MANSLADILGDKNFDEPTESVAIKRYVKEQFNSDVSVKVQEKEILITVPSPALANTLRLHTVQIKRFAATDKKLFFRIG
jgi:hypothetical protein